MAKHFILPLKDIIEDGMKNCNVLSGKLMIWIFEFMDKIKNSIHTIMEKQKQEVCDGTVI